MRARTGWFASCVQALRLLDTLDARSTLPGLFAKAVVSSPRRTYFGWVLGAHGVLVEICVAVECW